MIQFGYTIIYVPNVTASLQFFEQAFHFKIKFLHESGEYGELDTGGTTLAFASDHLGKSNLPQGFIPINSELPVGIEIALTTSEIETTHANALSMGAIEIQPPQMKPWGQAVSYIRCPDGLLIELCTPML